MYLFPTYISTFHCYAVLRGEKGKSISAHYVFMNVKYFPSQCIHLNFLTMYHVYAFGGNKNIKQNYEKSFGRKTTIEEKEEIAESS